MSETEREVLRLTLWIFGVSFSVKALVFGVLTGIMARQRAETAFGVGA